MFAVRRLLAAAVTAAGLAVLVPVPAQAAYVPAIRPVVTHAGATCTALPGGGLRIVHTFLARGGRYTDVGSAQSPVMGQRWVAVTDTVRWTWVTTVMGSTTAPAARQLYPRIPVQASRYVAPPQWTGLNSASWLGGLRLVSVWTSPRITVSVDCQNA